MIGKWAAFSENRELREVRLYDTTTTYPGYKLIYASSPHGEVQVDHGEGFFKKYNEDDGISEMGRIKAGLKTGVWKGFRKNGSLGYEEIYEKGVLKNGTLILENGDTIEYSAVFQAPKPIGGLERFNKYINRKIIYPTEAKMRGITGVVLVAFTVDETGAIKDPAIVKGIGFGCDEEALRVIRKANPWRPAYLRGIPVKQKVIQRVRFSLK